MFREIYRKQLYRMAQSLLGVLFFTSLLLPFASAEAVSPEIYTIDVQKIIDGTVAGKAARNNIEDAARKKEARIIQEQKQLKKAQEDYLKQRSLLSESAQLEREEALADKQRQFERMVAESKEDLSRLKRKEIARLVQQIEDVVADVADREEVRLVIERDSSLVLYIDEKYDFTQTVIDELDKRTVGL